MSERGPNYSDADEIEFAPDLDMESLPAPLPDQTLARPAAGQRLRLQALSEIAARNVRWLIHGLIPLRTLTLVAGIGGLGKSMWLIGIAARLSRGELDGQGAADTVIVSYEDTAAEVLRPRIEAAGGDATRIHVVIPERRDSIDQIAMPSDIPEIAALVRSVGAKLLIIDPIVAAIAIELDAHKDQHVRAVLAQLAELADAAELAVAIVGHLNKAPSTDAYIRIANSAGLWNASRSVVLITEEAESETRLIAQRKANYARLAPVERHRIEPIVLPHMLDPTDGKPIETARMVFVELAEEIDAADVLGPKTTKTESAEQLVAAILADGEWHEADGIKRLVAAAGFKVRTIQRAAQFLGAEIERRGFPPSTWWRISLAGANTPPSAPSTSAPDLHTKSGADGEAAISSGSSGAPVPSAPAPNGDGRIVIGDPMYPVLLADAAGDGQITEAEFGERYALDQLIERSRFDAAGERPAP